MTVHSFICVQLDDAAVAKLRSLFPNTSADVIKDTLTAYGRILSVAASNPIQSAWQGSCRCQSPHSDIDVKELTINLSSFCWSLILIIGKVLKTVKFLLLCIKTTVSGEERHMQVMTNFCNRLLV